jgi:hypothetical protein
MGSMMQFNPWMVMMMHNMWRLGQGNGVPENERRDTKPEEDGADKE